MRISGITYVTRKRHSVRKFLLIFALIILIAGLTTAAASIYLGLDLGKPALELLDLLYSWIGKLKTSLPVFNIKIA